MMGISTFLLWIIPFFCPFLLLITRYDAAVYVNREIVKLVIAY